jgi:hypothetical protein
MRQLITRNVRAFEASNPGASALGDFLGFAACCLLFGAGLIAFAVMFGE